jgi:hypothetical protein
MSYIEGWVIYFLPDVSVPVAFHRQFLLSHVPFVVGVMVQLPALKSGSSPGLAYLDTKLLGLVKLPRPNKGKQGFSQAKLILNKNVFRLTTLLL